VPLDFDLPNTRVREERSALVLRNMLVRAETLNEEQRTVEAVIATETRATVFDLRNYRQVEEILVMAGVEIPDQVPLLDSHPQMLGRVSLGDLRGSIRNLRVKGKELHGTLHFAGDPVSEQAWQLVRAGHVTDVSTGNMPLETIEIPPNTSQVVAGKKYKASDLPLLITIRWRPREGSLVPFGADQKSKIRTAVPTPPESSHMPANLRAYLESIGLKSDATDAEAWAFHANLRGEQLAQAETLRGNVAPPAPTPNPTPTPTPAPQRLPAPPLDEQSLRAQAAAAEPARILRMQGLAGNEGAAGSVG
jgi:hypothetical protein